MAEALHWTERSISEFVNRISFDFITQLAKKMESMPLKHGEFAKKLGLTNGRISQIFNNPGNLTLNKIVKYARALGMKVAVVAYEDGDSENRKGPISAEIFNLCWEKARQPRDFWSVESQLAENNIFLETSMLASNRVRVVQTDCEMQIFVDYLHTDFHNYEVTGEGIVIPAVTKVPASNLNQEEVNLDG